MIVYLLIEEHKADGASVLGVFDRELTQQEIDKWVAVRSVYKTSERKDWCKYRLDSYEVEDGN